ncbi:MAG: hypothetical protein J2P41_16125, partial [Blastocatellia bacterium]|nr:hypothetical protein [Blastocatellia bacterium]
GERFWLLAADLVCLDTFIGINVAIIYLATNISNEIGKSGKKRGWPFWLLIGLLHLIFQLAVPLLIVSKGTWQTWLIAVLLVFLVSPRTGEYLLKNNICWCGVPNRWWLLIAWITFGAMMLGLAFIGGTPLVDNIADYVTPAGRMFVGEERVKDVIGLISACMAGGVTSCIWLGWYLAVSLGFNGHNNEVGGAVRLENFKGFVRIRLTEETLSGFVIAVDEPQKQGGLLRPRIIDAFTLVMKPGE